MERHHNKRLHYHAFSLSDQQQGEEAKQYEQYKKCAKLEDINTWGAIHDDIYFEILSFLPSHFIIHDCSLVSKQFSRIIQGYRLKLEIKLAPPIEEITRDGLLSRYPMLHSLAVSSSIALKTPKDYLPASFYRLIPEKLKELGHLCLSRCGVGNAEFELLSNLKYLKVLDLSYNYLTDKSSHHVIDLHNLETLNISNNDIGVEWCRNISNLDNLTSLNISSSINKKDSDCSVEYILSMNNLTFLDISSGCISCLIIDKNLIGLQRLKTLVSNHNFNTSRNFLSDTTLKSLINLPNLNTLDISNSFLSFGGFKCVPQMKQLTSFSMRSVAMRDSNHSDILDLVFSMNNLTFLDISGNAVYYMGGDTIDRELVRFDQLTTFISSANTMGNLTLKSLANLPNLKLLDLSDCFLKDDDRRLISEMKQLTSLNLRGNRLANCWCKYISKLVNLKTLNISNNKKIGSRGIKYITQMHQLTSLDISDNRLSNRSCELISNLFNLIELDIRGCKISDFGLSFFRNLKNLKNLKY